MKYKISLIIQPRCDIQRVLRKEDHIVETESEDDAKAQAVKMCNAIHDANQNERAHYTVRQAWENTQP